MDKETTIGAIATAAAATGGWFFREYAKWLLTRQKAREEADTKRELEREEQERKRAESYRTDAMTAREELRSLLVAQVNELSRKVDTLTGELIKVMEARAGLEKVVEALREEIDELRMGCPICMVKKNG